ncbi:long-chain fatty acid--CoA ligase [Spirochaetia bacterium 38H-sp]|uniref:Long-chain fatty acid--CoA ligase n=1 Tax=Rarispira pelagica TaxID=3141764 RepID=A0ABU9UC38_9SPIR
MKNLLLMLKNIMQTYPNMPAQYVKDKEGKFKPIMYPQLWDDAITCALGLRAIGSGEENEPIALISENRREWLIADLGTMAAGAADVPRGCDVTQQELEYILTKTECKTGFFENSTQLKKALAGNGSKYLKIAILFDWDEDFSPPSSVTIINFYDLMEEGKKASREDREKLIKEIDKIESNHLATIIFTSGTTGEPKGVMLSHGNFLHQVKGVPLLINVGPGDIWLSVLPVWHSFERVMQYVALGTASAIAYSKPIGRIMLADMAELKPTWLASVPRIWESVKRGVLSNIEKGPSVTRAIFNGALAIGKAFAVSRHLVKGEFPRFKKRPRILDFAAGIVPFIILFPFYSLAKLIVFKKLHDKLGGRFVAGISGGGALPPDVDSFFDAVGIKVLEGYGLTEAAPVLGVRKQSHPVPGTIGPVFPGTEIQIRDKDGNVLKPGQQGIIFARGPQIMLGYYKNPQATKAVLDDQGWLNTGDIGMLTWDNELKITGRAKDTIVLRGGENIEPAPIETKLKEHPLVSNAVVVGQDKKFLAALLFIDTESLKTWCELNSQDFDDNIYRNPVLEQTLMEFISAEISHHNGFKSFERIYRVAILPDNLSVGEELSAKQEIKRHVILEKYKETIESLFQ